MFSQTAQSWIRMAAIFTPFSCGMFPHMNSHSSCRSSRIGAIFALNILHRMHIQKVTGQVISIIVCPITAQAPISLQVWMTLLKVKHKSSFGLNPYPTNMTELRSHFPGPTFHMQYNCFGKLSVRISVHCCVQMSSLTPWAPCLSTNFCPLFYGRHLEPPSSPHFHVSGEQTGNLSQYKSPPHPKGQDNH